MPDEEFELILEDCEYYDDDANYDYNVSTDNDFDEDDDDFFDDDLINGDDT